MENAIAIGVLNELSAGVGKVIGDLLVKVKMKGEIVSDVYIDGEKLAAGTMATVSDFKNTLEPCVRGEAKERGIDLEGFELQVNRESQSFRLECFGLDSKNDKVKFKIPAVTILHYKQ